MQRLTRLGLAIALVPAGLRTQTAGVAAAMSDLAIPERSSAACECLQRNGVAAVAPLRALLQRPLDADSGGMAQRMAALYVLGRLGRLAVTALPEVRQTFHDQGPAALRQQALWALGELAVASGDPSTCRDARDLLDAQWTQDLDLFTGLVVHRQLELGPWPDVRQVQARLLYRNPELLDVVVAARAVTGGRVSLEPLQQSLWRVLDRAVEDAWLPVRGQWRAAMAAGDLAQAFAERSTLARNATVQRGLLQHWDPLLRRAALVRLVDHAALPVLARADVVPLLWDADARVRLEAAHTLQRWGRAGLVGLVALRQAAVGDAGCKDACNEAATAIRQDVGASLNGKIAAGLLAELDGIARGQRPVAEVAFDSEANEIWSAAVTGARGVTVAARLQLLQLGERRGASGDAAVMAIAATIHDNDPAVVNCALGMLIRRRSSVLQVFPDPEPLMAAAVPPGSPMPGTGFEGLAWILAGPGATVTELIAALQHRFSRVRLRALVELAARGALADASVQRVAARITTVDEGLSMQAPSGGGWSHPVDAELELALGLCEIAGRDTQSYRTLVHGRFGVPPGEVSGWAGKEREAGRLGERLLAVEAMARTTMRAVDLRAR